MGFHRPFGNTARNKDKAKQGKLEVRSTAMGTNQWGSTQTVACKREQKDIGVLSCCLVMHLMNLQHQPSS